MVVPILIAALSELQYCICHITKINYYYYFLLYFPMFTTHRWQYTDSVHDQINQKSK